MNWSQIDAWRLYLLSAITNSNILCDLQKFYKQKKFCLRIFVVQALESVKLLLGLTSSIYFSQSLDKHHRIVDFTLSLIQESTNEYMRIRY